jgi:hypothetical protein
VVASSGQARSAGSWRDQRGGGQIRAALWKGQAHHAGGRRDRRGGGGQARAVEQARQARSAGGWRDQRGGGGCSRRLSKLAGYNYKIPRRVSPIRKCYLENFQALPATLDGCIVMASETTQERFLFGILMDAGMVLSGREAKDYNRTHFKLQRKREERKSYSD